MDWDIRDPADMDELRADLLACPRHLYGAVVAGFVGDPVAGLGFGLRRAVSDLTGGRIFDPAEERTMWRRVVENVLPTDGRHPDRAALQRFLAAAAEAGWSDPRIAPAPRP